MSKKRKMYSLPWIQVRIDIVDHLKTQKFEDAAADLGHKWADSGRRPHHVLQDFFIGVAKYYPSGELPLDITDREVDRLASWPGKRGVVVKSLKASGFLLQKTGPFHPENGDCLWVEGWDSYAGRGYSRRVLAHKKNTQKVTKIVTQKSSEPLSNVSGGITNISDAGCVPSAHRLTPETHIDKRQEIRDKSLTQPTVVVRDLNCNPEEKTVSQQTTKNDLKPSMSLSNTGKTPTGDLGSLLEKYTGRPIPAKWYPLMSELVKKTGPIPDVLFSAATKEAEEVASKSSGMVGAGLILRILERYANTEPERLKETAYKSMTPDDQFALLKASVEVENKKLAEKEAKRKEREAAHNRFLKSQN